MLSCVLEINPLYLFLKFLYISLYYIFNGKLEVSSKSVDKRAKGTLVPVLELQYLSSTGSFISAVPALLVTLKAVSDITVPHPLPASPPNQGLQRVPPRDKALQAMVLSLLLET